MPEIPTPAELKISSCIAQYVNKGNPTPAEREARAERLAKFLADPDSHLHVPARYVFWWLVIAFLLGFFLAGGFQR
jgi:hypothetical protein